MRVSLQLVLQDQITDGKLAVSLADVVSSL
jgi:hypothetical protein